MKTVLRLFLMKCLGGCSLLQDVKIPNGATSIGHHAFAGCSSITSLEIPSTVSSIEWGLLENCKSITSFALPDDSTCVRDEMFKGIPH